VLHGMRAPALNLTGRTGLGALAALVAQARLVVCNDTGISHIAAAVATSSVIVSCGSDTRRWAPLDHRRHRVVSSMVYCRPCMHTVCPIGHVCADNIAAPMVMAVARNMLNNNRKGLPS
jgi:ADP-heptose:LPS heptosyltransferase